MNSIFNKKTKEEKTIYDTLSSLSHTKWNCKYHIVFMQGHFIKYYKIVIFLKKYLNIKLHSLLKLC